MASTRIREVPGAVDVEVIGIEPEPEISIHLNQIKAGSLGLDNATVGKIVQYAFQGKSTRHSCTIGNNDFDIILQLDKENRRTIQDVADLRVSTANGTFVRLGDIADVTLSSGPTRIDREGRQRQIAVYANTSGISTGDLLSKIAVFFVELEDDIEIIVADGVGVARAFSLEGILHDFPYRGGTGRPQPQHAPHHGRTP